MISPFVIFCSEKQLLVGAHVAFPSGLRCKRVSNFMMSSHGCPLTIHASGNACCCLKCKWSSFNARSNSVLEYFVKCEEHEVNMIKEKS